MSGIKRPVNNRQEAEKIKQWWAVDYAYSKNGNVRVKDGIRLYVAEEVKKKKGTDIEWVDFGRVLETDVDPDNYSGCVILFTEEEEEDVPPVAVPVKYFDSEWLINGGSYAEMVAVMEEKGMIPPNPDSELLPSRVLSDDGFQRLSQAFAEAMKDGDESPTWYQRLGGTKPAAEALAQAIKVTIANAKKLPPGTSSIRPAGSDRSPLAAPAPAVASISSFTRSRASDRGPEIQPAGAEEKTPLQSAGGSILSSVKVTQAPAHAPALAMIPASAEPSAVAPGTPDVPSAPLRIPSSRSMPFAIPPDPLTGEVMVHEMDETLDPMRPRLTSNAVAHSVAGFSDFPSQNPSDFLLGTETSEDPGGGELQRQMSKEMTKAALKNAHRDAVKAHEAAAAEPQAHGEPRTSGQAAEGDSEGAQPRGSDNGRRSSGALGGLKRSSDGAKLAVNVEDQIQQLKDRALTPTSPLPGNVMPLVEEASKEGLEEEGSARSAGNARKGTHRDDESPAKAAFRQSDPGAKASHASASVHSDDQSRGAEGNSHAAPRRAADGEDEDAPAPVPATALALSGLDEDDLDAAADLAALMAEPLPEVKAPKKAKESESAPAPAPEAPSTPKKEAQEEPVPAVPASPEVNPVAPASPRPDVASPRPKAPHPMDDPVPQKLASPEPGAGPAARLGSQDGHQGTPGAHERPTKRRSRDQMSSHTGVAGGEEPAGPLFAAPVVAAHPSHTHKPHPDAPHRVGSTLVPEAPPQDHGHSAAAAAPPAPAAPELAAEGSLHLGRTESPRESLGASPSRPAAEEASLGSPDLAAGAKVARKLDSSSGVRTPTIADSPSGARFGPTSTIAVTPGSGVVPPTELPIDTVHRQRAVAHSMQVDSVPLSDLEVDKSFGSQGALQRSSRSFKHVFPVTEDPVLEGQEEEEEEAEESQKGGHAGHPEHSHVRHEEPAPLPEPVAVAHAPAPAHIPAKAQMEDKATQPMSRPTSSIARPAPSTLPTSEKGTSTVAQVDVGIQSSLGTTPRESETEIAQRAADAASQAYQKELDNLRPVLEVGTVIQDGEPDQSPMESPEPQSYQYQQQRHYPPYSELAAGIPPLSMDSYSPHRPEPQSDLTFQPHRTPFESIEKAYASSGPFSSTRGWGGEPARAHGGRSSLASAPAPGPRGGSSPGPNSNDLRATSPNSQYRTPGPRPASQGGIPGSQGGSRPRLYESAPSPSSYVTSARPYTSGSMGPTSIPVYSTRFSTGNEMNGASGLGNVREFTATYYRPATQQEPQGFAGGFPRVTVVDPFTAVLEAFVTNGPTVEVWAHVAPAMQRVETKDALKMATYRTSISRGATRSPVPFILGGLKPNTLFVATVFLRMPGLGTPLAGKKISFRTESINEIIPGAIMQATFYPGQDPALMALHMVHAAPNMGRMQFMPHKISKVIVSITGKTLGVPSEPQILEVQGPELREGSGANTPPKEGQSPPGSAGGGRRATSQSQSKRPIAVVLEEIPKSHTVIVRAQVEVTVYDRSGAAHRILSGWGDRSVFNLSEPLSLTDVVQLIYQYAKRQRIRMRDLFAIFDKDKDEHLNERELREMLSFITEDKQVGTMVRSVLDATERGMVSLRDLTDLLSRTKVALSPVGPSPYGGLRAGGDGEY